MAHAGTAVSRHAIAIHRQPRLTQSGCYVIRWRMTRVLTVRVTPQLLADAERRAAELGLDRGKYVRSLIEQDVSTPDPRTRTFASEDFIGSAPIGRGPYTNRRVRSLVRERLHLHRRHEENR
jgi:hypothetical protein